MSTHIRRTVAALAFAGLGLAAMVQPASAFFGSFQASCRDIHVYGDGSYMTAFCRRVDGSWHFSRIGSCGGLGVSNQNGHLRCGT